ncbi:choice-of-anchor M domain-containing protein [Trueperella pyogenes]|uniref:choice-of-anchor M domain-containing protein n=1 Tax=Trueperella pyogenes TaxID=1661 RepID=UPI002169B579|nr:choice-of-anchor M domain-containing protein [Trueperella pyogenes]UVJ57756.1 choice-of-anchor M domain-containing protein [Trueperella pyogenes]
MKEFLSRSAKVAAAAMTASLVALAPLTASAAPDRFELSGGHVDAFYVYNLPEETKADKDGLDTKLHLMVKEDVTGNGQIHYPNKVKFSTTGDSYTCFDDTRKEWFSSRFGTDGAYFPDKDSLPSKDRHNPGYSTHVQIPDPDDPEGFLFYDKRTLVFSDVEGPKGGSLVLYGIAFNPVDSTQKLQPELKNGKFVIEDGAEWELESGHHHAKWLATKAGTYRFKAQAVATYEYGDKAYTFKSDVGEYVWEFKESSLEGTCGSGSKPVEPGDSPTTPPDEDEDDWGDDEDEPGDEETTPDDKKPDDKEPGDDDEDEPSDDETGSTPDKFKPAPAPTPDKTKPAPAKPDPAPKQQEDHVVLDQGHTDIFNVSAKDGKLELNLKEDITGYNRIRTPEKVTLKVVEAARETISPNVYDGIMTSGYFLPFNEKKGILWPGWETFHVRPEFSHIDLNFVEVSGPGRVQILTQGSFGKPAPILKDGSIDLKTGSVIPVPEPTHVHTNWLFEKPGVYTMKVKASGKNKAGELVTSNTATYTWHVGDFKPGEKDDSSAGKTTPDTTDKDKAGSDTGKDKAVTPINIADSTKVRITAPKEIAVEKVDADHPLGYEQLAAAGFKVEALKAQTGQVKHSDTAKGTDASATQLKFGVDYTVSFGDPNRAGDNKIIVAGLGNYTGSVELPIKVVLKSASEQGTPSTGGQSTGTPDTTVPAAGTPNAVAPTAGTPATTRLSHTGASTILLTSLAALLLAGGAIFAVYRKKA